MNETLSILTPFVDMSKKDISVVVQNIMGTSYENGDDTLHLLAVGAKMQEMGEQIKKLGSKLCLSELQKYDGNKAIKCNVQLSQMESGVVYDYSSTPEIAKRIEEANQIIAGVKVLQDIAKIIKTRTEYTDQDGVQIVIMPAGKSSKTTIQCKIL